MRALEKKLPTYHQADLLDAIDEWEAEHNRPPTVRELADIFGVYQGAVWTTLARLKQKGYIDWDHNKARTLRGCGIVVVGVVS